MSVHAETGLNVQNEIGKFGITNIHWVYETTQNAAGIGVMAIGANDKSTLFGPAASKFDASTQHQSDIIQSEFDAVLLMTGHHEYELVSGADFREKLKKDPTVEYGIKGGIVGSHLLIPFEVYQKLRDGTQYETVEAIALVQGLAAKASDEATSPLSLPFVSLKNGEQIAATERQILALPSTCPTAVSGDDLESTLLQPLNINFQVCTLIGTTQSPNKFGNQILEIKTDIGIVVNGFGKHDEVEKLTKNGSKPVFVRAIIIPVQTQEGVKPHLVCGSVIPKFLASEGVMGEVPGNQDSPTTSELVRTETTLQSILDSTPLCGVIIGGEDEFVLACVNVDPSIQNATISLAAKYQSSLRHEEQWLPRNDIDALRYLEWECGQIESRIQWIEDAPIRNALNALDDMWYSGIGLSDPYIDIASNMPKGFDFGETLPRKIARSRQGGVADAIHILEMNEWQEEVIQKLEQAAHSEADQRSAGWNFQYKCIPTGFRKFPYETRRFFLQFLDWSFQHFPKAFESKNPMSSIGVRFGNTAGRSVLEDINFYSEQEREEYRNQIKPLLHWMHKEFRIGEITSDPRLSNYKVSVGFFLTTAGYSGQPIKDNSFRVRFYIDDVT